MSQQQAIRLTERQGDGGNENFHGGTDPQGVCSLVQEELLEDKSETPSRRLGIGCFAKKGSFPFFKENLCQS